MPSYDVKSGDKSTLAAKINSSQTSGVTIAAMNINGASTQWGNTAGVIEVSEQTDGTLKREWIYYTGISFDSSNVGTLSGVVRGLARDTSDTTSGGTGQAFSKGAVVRFVTFHDLFNKKANIDRANSFTATNTFATGGKIVFTSTAAEQFVSQGITEAQRDALSSPANGTIIYNTTSGQMNYREGGAWVTNGSGGSVADASTTVAGKVEEATAAELGASTAAGATGARLFINPSLAAKTSAGAGDENKVPVLNASGQVADGFLGTGTANSSTFLRGDRTWTPPNFEIFGTGADGAVVWSSSTNLNPATAKNYTTATLDAGQTLSVSSVNTPLIIMNTGDVTINGTVDLNGKGGAGGTGTTGAGTGGNGTAGNSIITGWTNGAGTGGPNAASAGGGGAGASWDADGGAPDTMGDEGTSGTKLDSDKYAFLSGILMRGVVCGGGGGGGSATTDGNGGAGGAGGGAMIWLIGGNLTLGASSIIRANAVAGTAGAGTTSGTAAGGGGGGGGMVIILVKGTITNSGTTVSATGGTGGASHASGAPNTNNEGGTGPAGKVIIYSLSAGGTPIVS